MDVVNSFSNQIVSERPNIKAEPNYGLPSNTPSQLKNEQRSRPASQYDPSSMASSAYPRASAAPFEVSRFNEKMEKFKYENNKMIADELENKGALLLQKREEYR